MSYNHTATVCSERFNHSEYPSMKITRRQERQVRSSCEIHLLNFLIHTPTTWEWKIPLGNIWRYQGVFLLKIICRGTVKDIFCRKADLILWSPFHIDSFHFWQTPGVWVLTTKKDAWKVLTDWKFWKILTDNDLLEKNLILKWTTQWLRMATTSTCYEQNLKKRGTVQRLR